jgi:hypothetical protein
MALVVNSADKSNGMPSAPLRVVEIDFDADGSYPNPGGAVTGGYTVPELAGATVVACEPVPHYDGAALRWADAVNGDSEGECKIRFRETANGAPAAESVDAANLAGHTGVKIRVWVQ